MLKVKVLLQEEFAFFAAEQLLSPSLNVVDLATEERFFYVIFCFLYINSPFSNEVQ